MDTAKLASIGGFVLSTALSSWLTHGSFVIDRPIQSCNLGFLIVGGLLVCLHILTPSIFRAGSADQKTLPGQKDRSLEGQSDPHTLSARGQRYTFGLTVIFVCARVEVFRQILGYTQCAVPGIEGLLPFLIAICEYFQLQGTIFQVSKPWRLEKASTDNQGRKYSTLKLLGPSALIAWATLLTSYISASPSSTYICPHASGSRQWTLSLQLIGLLLDCSILISIKALLERRGIATSSITGKAPIIIGGILILSAFLLSIFGAIACIIRPEFRARIRNVDSAYFGSLAWMILISTLLLIFAIRLLTRGSLLDFTLLASFTCTYIVGLFSSWKTRISFPGSLRLVSVSSLILLFTGIVLYMRLNGNQNGSGSHSSSRLFSRPSQSVYALLLLMFILRVTIDATPVNNFEGHPIDFLMSEASDNHKAWSEQATTSKTLSQAVAEYKRRYSRVPPPKFDKWYEYAVARHSLIIDDFDGLHQDLLPFWAFDPHHLRGRTHDILSDPWNEVAEVTIRSGRAEIGEKLAPTHRWMVEGAIAMMKDFIEFLPDMDLALNINDESRVAVPYDDLEKYRQLGYAAGNPSDGKENTWSTNRTGSWQSNDEPSPNARRFGDHSFTNTFYNYGSVSCPPNSAARRTHMWDPRSLCTSCFSPHSIGPFLRNWTLSASPCHQPDLANLHGFYLSPAAFKTARVPIPVFSQSKAHGYADLLYPSPWNYMDKVKYDPSPDHDTGEDSHRDLSFAEKRNTLFWRGATSEGLSVLGTWKGMTRQRLVHLANNHTAKLPVLLPSHSNPTMHEYQYLSPDSISSHPHLKNVTMDIAIVDHIVRCGDTDCPIQEAEFGKVPQMEFQEHWRYRYLMDVDGAGFSGRFLPFLQSRSLVFKTALFREWYDSRITAWRHFVPIDLRLHGLLSTLAYFAGGGKDGDGFSGKVKEGELIAEQGRDWVGKVLRKEDMEIYFFRLLLEWGRLTDDRRDQIGFDVPDT